MMMPSAVAASRAGGDGRAEIVRAVAGNVDDAAQAAIAVGIEELRAIDDGARDRRAAARGDRPGFQSGGEGIRILAPGDDLPRHEGVLADRARPFEIADGDAAGQAVAHGIDEVGMAQGIDIAGALHLRLLDIHGAGDVDRQHQFHIHFKVRGGKFRAGHQAYQQGKRRQHDHHPSAHPEWEKMYHGRRAGRACALQKSVMARRSAGYGAVSSRIAMRL